MPNPLILDRPLSVWLEIFLAALLLVQILSGLKIIKIPLIWHTKYLWWAIAVVALFQLIYTVSIYY